MATIHCVQVSDLYKKVSWEDMTKEWKKRFIVDDAPTLAINRIFTMAQGSTPARDWLTDWQKIVATPDLDLPFPHLRREFYDRSCAALSRALGDREQYNTFAEIIKTNMAAAHEKSSWQPTYVEKTIRNVGPLPRIDDLLERMGGAKFFSKLDLKSGYHQLEIRQEDRYKTAFKMRYGHFEWLVMPFGLTNAPATFQAAMTMEFRHMLDRYVLIYLDDILVYNRSLEEHVEHLRTVLERLRQAKYKANRDKCGAGVLGTLCDATRHPSACGQDRGPTSMARAHQHHGHSFIHGIAGYYQRFITGYSRIAAPMTRLQSPKVQFIFDDDARRSFQALKTAMLMAPVLSIYDPTLPTRVTTDASGYGIGALLEQHDGDDWHPVEYFSHKVPPINSLDDARKKELLAFVMALKRWRHFLLGRRRFTWVTDNNPFTYYKTQDTVSSTIGRWMYFIDQFDFTLKHLPGLSNRAADALSRRPDLCAMTHHAFAFDEELQRHFIQAYESDPDFATLYAQLSLDHPPASHYRIANGYFSSTREARTYCVSHATVVFGLAFSGSTTTRDSPAISESTALLHSFDSDSDGPISLPMSLGIATLAKFADAASPATAIPTASYARCLFHGKLVSPLPWTSPVLLTDYLRCLPAKVRTKLVDEAYVEQHTFASFSKKALDIEAKLGSAHQVSHDSRKRLPQDWKKKGQLMFVDHDGQTMEIDDFPDLGEATEQDGASETSDGGVVAPIKEKARGTGKKKIVRSTGQGDQGTPAWVKLGLDYKVWRDLVARGTCMNCSNYGHTSRTCRGKKVTTKAVKTTPEIELVIAQYSDLFEEPTGVVEREVVHVIEVVPGSEVPRGRVYRMSPAVLYELRRQLKELTEKGWIRPSTSPYSAPVLFVPKKGGTLRMCIDYRGLNAITVKNAEPLPHINDLLDRVQGCRYFTKIDLKSVYHQIAIRLEDQHKTAFQTRYGLYEFVVMPFGLCNAPGTFQHSMNRIFHNYLDKFIAVYLDDILILSRTVEEHAEHLKTVLGLLRQHQYKVNLEKCEFGRTKILYLGHEISADGLRPDDAKVASIHDWPRPQTVTEVRSFLGMTGYYHPFVKNYSAIASPLTDLTQLDTPWERTEECEAAFRKLKYALTHYEVLKLPDPDKSFVVTTDASQYGIGAVLAQKEGPKSRPIEYMSKKMPSQKLAKSTYECELYALYRALVHWRHYLLGRFFHVRSDHETVRWIKTRQVLSDALKHWIQVIDMYDYQLDLIKGEYNKVADALSRRADYLGALVTEFGISSDLTRSLVSSID
ncbi:hypothetical protein CBR_g31367 [Chara braunii]|uniref:Reverse transcriptase domain-containing protein n=1 Tax=Chara braunii TaxID=69332 RepID=A0A388LEU4_CHABU|nr:hypothetical protein CBR_g31367 [Chara braunii]|eukprot:GBG80811.1 hypothetical protein CBR_g31367 [Chara braunii]